MATRFLLGLLWVSGTAYAQAINLRGKVTNPAAQPVSGAIVELAGLKLKDTTAADGTYALSRPATALPPRAMAGHLTLNGNVLELLLGQSQPVTLEVFDLRGNLLRRQPTENLPAGAHRWDLSESAPPENVRIIKASVGGQTRMFRHLPVVGRGYASLPPSDAAAASARLAKASRAVDTLKVAAPGFAPKAVPLSRYDSTVHVTLEPSGGGVKNPPGKSAGCGKPSTLTSGKKTITSSNQQRSYILDIPADYDMNKPYRLFYVSHWINGTSEQMRDNHYYGLKPLANAANQPAIFLAPQSDGGTWQQKDHVLFDDLLAHAKANLCIDTTRVFATGFSFGGMITYSLSTNHQKQLRAAVGLGPANYNIWLPNPKLKDPIPWMQTTGLSDGTTPWVNNDAQKRGAKYIALEKAADNGCTLPADIPIWRSGAHVCYDFQGCKEGYPVKVCTFNGGHTEINRDPGSNVNWIPQESWKFFLQF